MSNNINENWSLIKSKTPKPKPKPEVNYDNQR